MSRQSPGHIHSVWGQVTAEQTPQPLEQTDIFSTPVGSNIWGKGASKEGGAFELGSRTPALWYPFLSLPKKPWHLTEDQGVPCLGVEFICPW